MKILYYHQHFSTPAGSVGTRSYENAKKLIDRGHKVTMICGTYGGGVSGLAGPFTGGCRRGVVEGIDVVEFELPYSNYDSLLKRTITFLRYALRSIVLALKEPCDLVFATTTPLTAGLPGIFSRWLRGKRFVFEVRDLWPELPKAMGVITNPVVLGLMSALEWVSYRSAHACIGLSPGIIKGIKKRSRVSLPVTMIPNGCDLDLFSSAGIQALRPDGVRETDLMAVFTGAHGLANGLDAMIRTAEVLKQRGRNDIKLVFIGDGKLKPGLRREAEEKKLDICIFLDPVAKDILAAYMKGADLGLMILTNIPAFYYGTSPNKFFDYLAIGLPVLNNYPGWLADLINEYKCGYSIEPDNSELFADALEDAADNREELHKMGGRAQALGRDQFARGKLAVKFVQCLESA